MQIFVTNENPYKAANRLWLNPIRARKMITETQQILACCEKHFFNKVTILKINGAPYKTHKSRMNHPCVKWACESKNNVSWLINHLTHLFNNYKGNAFVNVKHNITLLNNTFSIESNCHTKHTQFLNFAKADSKQLDFTHMDNVFKAYDLFLKAQNS